MRWPWTPKPPPLPELDEDDDAAEAAEALRRAREALRKAEANGSRMREVAGAIHRERQRNNFGPGFYQAMKRKET